MYIMSNGILNINVKININLCVTYDKFDITLITFECRVPLLVNNSFASNTLLL